MNSRFLRLFLGVWAALSLLSRAAAEPPAAKESPATAPVLFTAKIRPVLTEICLKCHGPEKSENSLRLDSRAALLRGGETGPAIIPGKPDDSLLIQAIRQTGDLKMPPDGKLPDDSIKAFEDWVHSGAEWPGGDLVASKKATDQTYWAFKPIKSVNPPRDRNGWSALPVDRFLEAGHRAAGLAPAADADKRTLIRRVTLDLTGLPPTPEDIEGFVNDGSPEAWRKVIDRLLDSPRYGERWGRHWLDVVRYADAGGFEKDTIFPDAWKYRDYIIRSFNSDKPLDRFIQEQVAGDELWPDDKEAALGTGMYCVAPVQEESAGSLTMQLENDWLTDAADTTGAAFLALTMGCSRCHNHKYDPITQQDYYSLQAFFAASDRPYAASVRDRRIKALHGILAEVPVPKEFANDPNCKLRMDKDVAFALFHREEPLEVHLLHRGELSSPREAMKPAIPAALTRKGTEDDPALAAPTGRRAVLAKWLTAPDNPLSARVLANRVWGWHFGQGLVRTANDFGKQGDRPSHPELLDWLARDLVDHGWSLKHLQREILLSRAYRMESAASAADVQKDPENRLLSHFPRQRLDAEEVRDSLLACAGTLNLQPFGPPVTPPLSKQELSGFFQGERWTVTHDASEHARRSVYILVRRSFALPLLATFDAPGSMVSCSRRNTTIVPTQALALLNGPLAQEQSAAFARRIRTESGQKTESALSRAWHLTFGREPTAAEIQRAVTFLRDRTTANERLQGPAQPSAKSTESTTKTQPTSPEDEAWAELCLALFNANEFIYID